MKRINEETAATILVVLLIALMILIAYKGSENINRQLEEITV